MYSDLRFDESARLQLFVTELDELLRHELRARRLDAFPDALRGAHRNLLADDRARERGERIVAIDEVHGAELRDQLLEDAVALHEVGARLVPVRRDA